MDKLTLPEDIDVLILCGGIGKRLQGVTRGWPKPLIEINGEPFLDILIKYVAGFGFRRFVLCTGYKAEEFRQNYNHKDSGVEIVFSEEAEPLGTGGALANAKAKIKSGIVLVMNGDSLCEVDFCSFINFHIENGALCSMVLVAAEEATDYGLVVLNQSQQVTAFNEKTGSKGEALISAGIYLFKKDIFSMMPENKNFSLEYDFFPNIINAFCYGYRA